MFKVVCGSIGIELLTP
nr:hypothetical protein [Vibrio cholerae]